MHLKQIKLVGFKSFVDPTVLHLDNNLIGIVGPNGCGKSNIIDAIRWVLGESSAKDLRGESMLDVIFNGSSIRKPISIASIELLFENVAGKLTREYANFTEVAIRREVNRERQSEYYLNDKKCRKRDITDLFAGTGLLQNGYAIIGQGTVSKIIESKPEDLRFFIEEAANISIYKKRRHETELRMSHTEENLSRVQDIIQEQARLLEKLEKQSVTAKKYQAYQQQKQQLEIKLIILKSSKLNQDLLDCTKKVQEISLELEKYLVEKHKINLNLEQQKSIHYEKSDLYAEIQEKYYTANTEIAKLEQTLLHQQAQQTKLQQNLSLINQELTKINEQYAKDQQYQQEIITALQAIKHEYTASVADKNHLEQEYLMVQQDLANLQPVIADLQFNLQAIKNNIHQHQNSLEQIENLAKEFCARIEKLQHEKNNYNQDSLLTEILLLEQELRCKETVHQSKQEKLLTIHNNINNTKLAIKNLLANRNDLQSKLHKVQGTIGSLNTLQQAALELNATKLAWLRQHQIDPEVLLCNQLTMPDGIEVAIAVALNQYLDAIVLQTPIAAIELNDWESVKDFRLVLIEDMALLNINNSNSNEQKNNMALLNINNSNNICNDNPQNNMMHNNKISLASKIQNNYLKHLLQHIYLVENLEAGFKQRQQLLAHEFFVTKHGELLGVNWLIIDKLDHKQKILLRNKELKLLQVELGNIETALVKLNIELEAKEFELLDFEKIQADIINDNQQEEQVIRKMIAEVSAKKSKSDGIKNRIVKITEEIKEYHNKINNLAGKEQGLRTNLSEEINKISSLSTKEQELLIQRSDLQEKLQPLSINNKLSSKKFHEISLKQQQLITTEQGLQEATNRLLNQISILTTKQTALQLELNANDSPLEPLKLQLAALLNAQVTQEKKLQLAKHDLQAVELDMQELEDAQQQLNETIDNFRTNLENIKLAQQTISVRLNDLMETAANNYMLDLQTILNQDDLLSKYELAQVSLSELHANLDAINKKINKLGMVNLAAIDEFTLELERKNHLDLQFTDLTTALETLRNAIAKIDLETKKKFNLTFEQVNTNFQQLFPTLFGGGGAYLELTSNDLLATGVSVFAHPPGKKNSSIYLLSGGEKALTAVALIFSIFQLNPAPFCILDEVDAPLDEANVIRYSDLLVSMSKQVQFIFITHNKTTMKIANQLIGVTMKEPGVSRLVSVNVDEAVALIN